MCCDCGHWVVKCVVTVIVTGGEVCCDCGHWVVKCVVTVIVTGW